MDYLLDSDIVIDHLKRDPITVQLLDQLASSGMAISIVTYMEACQGVIRGPDPVAAEAMFDDFLTGIVVITFSEEIARRCARLREGLRQQGKRVRPRALDLLTAATALHHNLTLVT